MKRSGPLKRKTPLRSKKPLGWGKKRKPLKARSPKRQAQYQDTYIPGMEQFLKENPWCQVRGCDRPSGTVHHRRKRNGKRLDDQEFWMATCCLCNGRMEDDPEWAFRNGYKLRVNRSATGLLDQKKPSLGSDQTPSAQETFPTNPVSPETGQSNPESA